MEISSTTSFSMKTRTLYFRSPTLSPNKTPFSLQFSVSNRTQIQNSIKCARSKKTRSGSIRSTVLMLHSAYLIASKLRIIPEPLDLAIREFAGGGGGGNGGGLGFGKDFGWGWFDGGRRSKKRKLGLLWVFVAACGLWLILGKEIDSDLFRGILGLSLFGFSINGWKLGFKDWILGFCCCAFFVSLGVNRDNLQSWVKGFSSMEIFRGRRKRRRGLW